MLHILLCILAFIGKLLLILLGLILLIILLVLFVPIRYRGNFRKQEKKLEGHAAVSWLLRLVLVQVDYVERKPELEIRLLGIPLLRLLKWIKERKTKKKKTEAEYSELAQSNTEQEETSVIGIEEKTPEVEETACEAAPAGESSAESLTEGAEAETPLAESVSADPEKDLSAEAPKQGLSSKIATVLSKIGRVLQKILRIPGTVISKLKALAEKIKAVFGKLRKLLDKVNEIIEFLQSDMFKEIFALVKKEVLAMLRSILPRKLWGRIEFGLSDPGTTGEILAVIGMIYPILPEKLVICPDFEEEMLNADVSLKGRICLAVLLFHGIKILLNKQVRRLIKKLRHKEA